METPKRPHDAGTGAQPEHRVEINVHDGFDVRHWAKEFDVSAEQVISAVKRVGPAVADVRRELKREGL